MLKGYVQEEWSCVASFTSLTSSFHEEWKSSRSEETTSKDKPQKEAQSLEPNSSVV